MSFQNRTGFGNGNQAGTGFRRIFLLVPSQGGKGSREDSGVRWEEEGARSGRRDEREEVRGGRKKK